MTWKGESGEGYMIHGIWMDADINKFFSKLVLPKGRITSYNVCYTKLLRPL